MSASYFVLKNGVVTSVSNPVTTSKKCNIAHGNPSSSVGIIGKHTTKVRNSGPKTQK
jgi:hypothetical protein